LKDRAERLESAQDIFAANEGVAGQIKNSAHLNNGALIIVIDDVITTGGTIRDAIDTLRRRGLSGLLGCQWHTNCRNFWHCCIFGWSFE